MTFGTDMIKVIPGTLRRARDPSGLKGGLSIDSICIHIGFSGLFYSNLTVYHSGFST